MAATHILRCILLVSSFCRTVNDRPVMGLFTADAAVKSVDVCRTESNYDLGLTRPCSLGLPGPCGFTEDDPLARPLVGHPAAFYSAEYGVAFGFAWLGDRVRHSKHRWLRDLWWAPQAFSIGDNAYGIIYSARFKGR